MSVINGSSAYSIDFTSQFLSLVNRTQEWCQTASEKPWQEIALDVARYAAALILCILVSPILIPVVAIGAAGYGLYKAGCATYHWSARKIAEIRSCCEEPPAPRSVDNLPTIADEYNKSLNPPKKSFWFSCFSCCE